MSRAAPTPRSQPESAWLRDLVPLRPQGPVEVIDRATHLLRTRFRDLITVSLAINLPVWLILAVLLRDRWAQGLGDNPEWFWSSILPEPFLFFATSSGLDGSTWAFVVGRGLPSLGLAATGATVGHLIAAWSAGRDLTGGAALALMVRQGHRVLALWAVIHILQIVTCIGVVAGPVAFGIAMPLWAMEGTKVMQAVGRSWKLSLRDFWRSLLVVGLATGLSLLVGILISTGPLLLLVALAGGWIDFGGAAVVSLTGALPHLIIDPLICLCMALLALDLRVRVEGADLEADLDALADTRG